MVNLTAGQAVRVYAAVEDFCGEVSKTIYVSDVIFNAVPLLRPAGCLDISGIGIGFRLVTMSGTGECSMCTPGKVYSTWGTAYTNSQGIAYIEHTITDEDLAAYQEALSAGNSLKVLACISGPKGQQVSSNRCSDILTILPGAAPTHYISLSMGFVPPELTTYFQIYITEISNTLMTKIAPPPAPWQYIKTTFDAAINSFNLWFYTPSSSVMAMTEYQGDRGFMQYAGARGKKQVRYGFMSIQSDIQGLSDWITAWVPVITGILMILIASFGPFGVFADVALLFTGLVILGWKVVDATSKQIIADTKATNLNIQLDQNNKEVQARSATEDAWNKSAKTQADCTARLQSHADIHLATLNGYLNLYAKYPGLVTELNKEKDTFTANANGILVEFKTASYAAGTCDIYFVRLNSEIGTSNVAVNDSLGRYIKIDETYLIACKGWKDQANCEKGGCFWYSASCNQEEQCWIPDPLGGCVLSARTGKAVVGATAAIFLTAFAYWLFTRKEKEVVSIYSGAKEVVTGEASCAKTAYKAITSPSETTA